MPNAKMLAWLVVAACSSDARMNDPKELARAAGKVPQLVTDAPVQYGQSLQLNVPTTATQTIAVGVKDVVRWKGVSGSDSQPARVYLGPWQPQPGLAPIPPPVNPYAAPTPWTTWPPLIYDSMIPQGFSATGNMLYARISFGGGGVQHQAFVDWPPRGLLLQISAQYIQVDAVVSGNTPIDQTTLPRLLAHVGPEPGGGDAVNSATFTYPYQDNGVTSLLVQVPPFARAFTPLMDRQQMIALGNTQLTIAQLSMQNTPNATVHVWDASVGSDWPDDRGIPLTGYTSNLFLTVQPKGGGANDIVRAGMIFHLDL